MHAGACAARGEVLWFVHADTHPPVDGVRHILEALAKCHVVGGCFRVCFDGSSRVARLLTRLSPCLDWPGLCYGDATLFVRRAIYERAGTDLIASLYRAQLAAHLYAVDDLATTLLGGRFAADAGPLLSRDSRKRQKT